MMEKSNSPVSRCSDLEHPRVHTPVERFEEYMQYLKDENYKVIAFHDLANYVDPEKADPGRSLDDHQQT
ncbi:MAG: hypothetical protein R3C11_05715 [Planctomycetaceae bacterium]